MKNGGKATYIALFATSLATVRNSYNTSEIPRFLGNSSEVPVSDLCRRLVKGSESELLCEKSSGSYKTCQGRNKVLRVQEQYNTFS